MPASDVIEVRRLRVSTFIGVPDDERAEPQTVLITVRMTPSQDFDGLSDEISRTVDYHAVALEIQALAAARPRRLIETLAVEIAGRLLASHPLRHVANGIGEAHPQMLGEEGEDVAALAAHEALEVALARIDREVGPLAPVQRARAPEGLPRALEARVLGDDLQDVRSIADPLDQLVRDQGVDSRMQL